LPPPLPASPATPGALSDSRKLLIFGLMAFGQFTRDSRRALAMAQAETGRIVGRQAATLAFADTYRRWPGCSSPPW
jgi:hypothetical protein